MLVHSYLQKPQVMKANYEHPVQMLYCVDKRMTEKQQNKTKRKKLPFHSSRAVILGDYLNYIQLFNILDDEAND